MSSDVPCEYYRTRTIVNSNQLCNSHAYRQCTVAHPLSAAMHSVSMLLLQQRRMTTYLVMRCTSLGPTPPHHHLLPRSSLL
jgi:hypothetical protein